MFVFFGPTVVCRTELGQHGYDGSNLVYALPLLERVGGVEVGGVVGVLMVMHRDGFERGISLRLSVSGVCFGWIRLVMVVICLIFKDVIDSKLTFLLWTKHGGC